MFDPDEIETHEYVLAPLAVRVAEPPVQIALAVELTFNVGVGVTPIPIVCMDEHKEAVPTTEQVELTEGVTKIVVVLAELPQVQLVAPITVKVVVSPEHKLGELAVIFNVGEGVTATAIVFVPIQPTLVPLTVQVVCVVGLIVVDAVVELLLQV